MITAEQVAAPVYDFLSQLEKKRPIGPAPAEAHSMLETVLAVWEHFGDFAVETALGLSEPEYQCFGELLKQYLEFLFMFPHLRFPAGFLKGTSGTSLGGPLREYIAENRWPFPRQLPQ